MIKAVKATLTLIALATVAAASVGVADAKTLVRPIVKTPKLPSLHVDTHPQLPKICLNPLDKGPGTRKCG